MKPDRSKGVIPDILGLIGQTPLVRLNHVLPEGSPTELWAKVEYVSPSGGLKDRMVVRILEEAERAGDLKPGMELLEASTGSTGIATSLIGAVKGYPVTIVMPEGMSAERKALIRGLGAQLILTPGGGSDVDQALAKLDELDQAHPGRYFTLHQFSNPANPTAHYLTTGPEVWEQTGGQVDALVAAQGTGGTVSGTGRFLREKRPDVKVFTVEPLESPLLAKGHTACHLIEGIADGVVPDNLDIGILDGVIEVPSEEAIRVTRKLIREEGLLCGTSSGANVAACVKLVEKEPNLRCVVTVLNDTALRYLSTDLFRMRDEDDGFRKLPDSQRERVEMRRLPVIE